MIYQHKRFNFFRLNKNLFVFNGAISSFNKHRNDCERYQNITEEEKRKNMTMNNLRIFLNMKNKG